jgi:5-methyltetrahydrofolate--homocysteine methyltransferase
MSDPKFRREALYDALASRILVLDGAMGTEMQRCNLHAHDFGGAQYEGCNENLVLTRPDVVLKVHRDYLTSGSDIIETNTFGSMPVVLAEYGLESKAYEISATASRLARQAADEFSTPEKPRFVAASIGPTTKMIALTGGITFDELTDNYYEQFRGLIDGGADILLIETCPDTLNVKAALRARERLVKALGHPIPTMVSGTIEMMGTMLAGQPAEALYTSVAHADLLSIGLNCATGPEFMTDHIRSLNEIAETRISCYPNAGLPNEEGKYLETPTSLASQLERFADNGWLNIVGGCCGTTPDHIAHVARAVEGLTPRKPAERPRAMRLSGLEPLELS